MTSGILIISGIFLIIPAVFFFVPWLAALSGVVTASDEAEERIRKTYRPLARTLLFLGTSLILGGVLFAM